MQYKVQQVSGFSIFQPHDFSHLSTNFLVIFHNFSHQIIAKLPRVNHFFLRLFQLRTQQQQQNQAVELIFRDASLSVNNTGRVLLQRVNVALMMKGRDEPLKLGWQELRSSSSPIILFVSLHFLNFSCLEKIISFV